MTLHSSPVFSFRCCFVFFDPTRHHFINKKTLSILLTTLFPKTSKMKLSITGSIFLCISSASAFTSNPLTALTTRQGRLGTLQLRAIETVSLDNLQDHEEDGTKLAESITKWLDQEWIPQQVHIDMAMSAKKSYIECRAAGRDDVGDILMQVSDDLSENWHELYHQDAFVNPWDIANYVSDYLIKASGNEGCACSEAIL